MDEKGPTVNNPNLDMFFVYRGKINWFIHALDEGFTLIFPDSEFKGRCARHCCLAVDSECAKCQESKLLSIFVKYNLNGVPTLLITFSSFITQTFHQKTLSKKSVSIAIS